ncbi:hypothetical protein MFIFM68171_09530 [Madurella fahalii]|uniref:Uncharacterized protein n=1 Tax=Madurella fahalii TaxID=1157608 RepID=A0ABQ0GNR9_9PEZI
MWGVRDVGTLTYQDEIVSVTDFVCLIIEKCSSLFHPRSDEADDKLYDLHVFALAIGELIETTHGVGVQDSIEDSPEDIELKYTQTLATLTRRNGDIGSLKTKAYRVYKDLCDLLDLKQKQASVSAALSARQEAKETAKQGKTILLFTIITILFLPLSFIAAIFSMNAHEIIPESNRPISEIFSIMFPTTVAILFLSLFLGFNNSISWLVVMLFSRWQNRLRWPKKQADRASNEV